MAVHLSSRPATGRLLVAATLVLSLGLAVVPALGAHAGNSGQTDCLVGYNFANPSTGYLFASTEGTAWGCSWVHADIHNNAFMTGPGFVHTRCLGGTQLAYQQDAGYVAASATLASGSWSTPCSNHYGAPSFGQRFHDWGALSFLW